MTLLELQDVLSNRIKVVENPGLSAEDHAREIETSKIVASLAKQMINNADVILRADKLVSSGAAGDANIKMLVSGDKDK